MFWFGGGGGEGQGGCELRGEAFVNIQKKKNFFLGGGWVGGGVGLGCQGGCEWRSEAFVKIQKEKFFFFFWGGGSGPGGGQVEGVRVDGNGELKLL